MNPNITDIVAASIFVLAILHTFAAKQFERLAHRSKKHAGVFHLLGEVEVVFGFWAFVLMAVLVALDGFDSVIAYLESRAYTEPLFVFAIMVVSASRPVMYALERLMQGLAARAPLRPELTLSWLGLSVVPVLGSLVTEPAAMTLAALMLAPVAFRSDIPEWPKYFALGTLFVNVSIGGTLTAYAAPPVLMVAKTWSWDTWFMLSAIGWKAAIAVLINAAAATMLLRKHLAGDASNRGARVEPVPVTVVVVHLALLAGIVLGAHHPVIFIGLLLMFLGFAQAYERYQNPLILREALLVGFFLAGLVVIGGFQRWWIQPAIDALDGVPLFVAALGLTSVADNAALTYLGSLSANISEESKYWLVAGAVAGGGLTVIANAPNPAGLSLLKRGFSDETVSALGLLAGALFPTAIAVLVFVAL